MSSNIALTLFQVSIPGEKLTDVCAAAHALGIHGLVEFLPDSSGSGKSKPAPRNAANNGSTSSTGETTEQQRPPPANQAQEETESVEQDQVQVRIEEPDHYQQPEQQHQHDAVEITFSVANSVVSNVAR